MNLSVKTLLFALLVNIANQALGQALSMLVDTMPSIRVSEIIVPAQLSRLYIVNETRWHASVFWEDSEKMFNTVVNAHQTEMLGILSYIKNLEIGTYGEIFGRMYYRHNIPLEKLKLDTSRDGYIIIQEQYWGQSWSFVCESREKHLLSPIVPAQVKEVLPGVVRARQNGRPIMAHHILNIDPSYASADMIANVYDRLREQWAPEKFSFNRTVTKISEIVHAAYLALQRELINGHEHVEKTVFTID